MRRHRVAHVAASIAIVAYTPLMYITPSYTIGPVWNGPGTPA